jgi:MoxR-like ATPase
MPDWGIYRGVGEPHDGIADLPDPPSWRVFDDAAEPVGERASESVRDARRAATYRPDPETVELVNAALFLRRPALVTGPPGSGKSTLAYAVAHELGLGKVLHWPITSRIMLRDGLYQYDPLGRLYSVSTSDSGGGRHSRHGGAAPEGDEVRRAGGSTRDGDGVGRAAGAAPDGDDIGQHIRLGPLGTALLPWDKPRVLLIDEIDKSDLDLPNDLLTIFEEGEYLINELERRAHPKRPVTVMTADGGAPVPIRRGLVRCRAFPFVVMTSNNERDFPPAFLRRCIQIRMEQPGRDKLRSIVAAHLSDQAESSEQLIQTFVEKRNVHELATDQLLNAIYLVNAAARRGAADRTGLAEKVLSPISTHVESDEY